MALAGDSGTGPSSYEHGYKINGNLSNLRHRGGSWNVLYFDMHAANRKDVPPHNTPFWAGISNY